MLTFTKRIVVVGLLASGAAAGCGTPSTSGASRADPEEDAGTVFTASSANPELATGAIRGPGPQITPNRGQSGRTLQPEYTGYPGWVQWSDMNGHCAADYSGNGTPVQVQNCDQSNVNQFFLYNNGYLRGVDWTYVWGPDETMTGIPLQNGTATQWDYAPDYSLHQDTITGPPVVFDTWHDQTNNLVLEIGNTPPFSLDSGWGNYPNSYHRGTMHAYQPADTGYVLDLNGNQRYNGRPVDIAPDNGTTAQQWTMIFNGNLGTFQFQLTGTNFCLDKPLGQNGNGTHLEIWTCNSGLNQQWYLLTGQAINMESNTCLDAPLLNWNNPTLDVWTCNGGLNQMWNWDTLP
jgi:hypothetical protein